MEYFKLLHLAREPFSNSPDPAFFYESAQHKDCLQKLEIALRLRRGLNVVTGKVGTGKTTLCRQLIQALSGDPAISACLLLDPDFPDPRTFLSAVVHAITGQRPADSDTMQAMKEQLKHYLFQKGVEEDRTLVLIVDEGQKMAPACLETLRELLNFETNEYKLFQVVIFAQSEFEQVLENIPNLADRVNLYYRLGPLNFKDTRALIRHRLRLAGGSTPPKLHLFSLPALRRLFRFSSGYPRKIVHLCHQCLLAMIIQNKTKVTRRMVGACARRTFVRPRAFKWLPASMGLIVLAIAGFGALYYSGGIQKTEIVAQNEAETSAPMMPSSKKDVSEPSKPESAEPAPYPGIFSVAEVGQEASLPVPLETPSAAVEQKAVSALILSKEETPPGETPEFLGSVRVAMGDTLGELLQKVYGSYRYRYYQAVLAANPELTDPNSLIAGQLLSFPALTADMNAIPDSTWWVSLSQEPDLQYAVTKLREEALEDLPLRLLAVQSLIGGFSFRVVLKTCFENETEAQLAMEQLRFSTPTTTEVFCLKKNEAIVYGSLN